VLPVPPDPATNPPEEPPPEPPEAPFTVYGAVIGLLAAPPPPPAEVMVLNIELDPCVPVELALFATGVPPPPTVIE
jgi:hypothetical protein